MIKYRLAISAIAISLSFVAIAGCHRSEPEPAVSPSEVLDPSADGYEPPLWDAPPTAVKSLAAAVPIGDFTVRPPAGYVLTVTREKAKPMPLTRYTWRSLKLPDGTRATLNVVVRKVSDSPFDTSALSRANWLGRRVRNYLPNVITFDAEPAMRQGLDCAAVFWKAWTVSGDKHRQGLIYVYRSPSEVIEFDGVLSEANVTPVLSTLQASALSLIKR